MRNRGIELLETVHAFHRQRREQCEALEVERCNEPLRAFIEYFQESETHCETVVAAYQSRPGNNTSKRVFRYPPEETPLEFIEDIDMHPHMSAEEVMVHVVRQQNRLVAWLEDLASQITADSVEEDFRRLADFEQNMAKKLARSNASLT